MAKPIVVEIKVDSHGVFEYKVDQQPLDDGLVIVGKKDTLAWDVRIIRFGIERPLPFQITFKTASPFGRITEIRSDGGRTRPLPVSDSLLGTGLPYTVSLSNGWSNDPEAMVDSVGEHIERAVPETVKIQIDSVGGHIQVSPTPASANLHDVVRWESLCGAFTIKFNGVDTPFKRSVLSSNGNYLSEQVTKGATDSYTYSVTAELADGEAHGQIDIS